MRRFFYNSYQRHRLGNYNVNDSIELTEDIHHHWCRVLRAKVSEQAVMFDGFGGEYLVELIEIHKKSSSVRLLSYLDTDSTNKFYSKIGLVMSRGDRMDYAIQKATELGVTAIQLLTSHHGEVRLKPSQVIKKLTHWQQVALSACEQSGLNRPPIILSPIALDHWLNHLNEQASGSCEFMQAIMADDFYQSLATEADMSLVLAVPNIDQPPTPRAIQALLNKNETPLIQLLIGSEGGLSDEELTQAQTVGFQPWQIGNRVLRTETAPTVALATLNAWIESSNRH